MELNKLIAAYDGTQDDTVLAGYITERTRIQNEMENQGLVDFVERDEMIMTTKKLDNFMDWNILNQKNYHRVLKMFSDSKEETVWEPSMQ